MGMVGALELVRDKATNAPFEPEGKTAARVRDVAQGKGLILRAVRDILCLAPPLVIHESELEEMFDILASSLDTVYEETRALA